MDAANTSKNSLVIEKNDCNMSVSSTKKRSKKKERKRKYSSSNDNSDSEKETKKAKSKHKKKCKKRHKHGRDKSKSKHKYSDSSGIAVKEEDSMIGPEIPSEILQKARSMAPVGKEEWEKKQNTIRRVYDEETGRSRLVRGEGEIIEEIVSRERHKEINRQATLGDGQFFQSTLRKKC